MSDSENISYAATLTEKASDKANDSSGQVNLEEGENGNYSERDWSQYTPRWLPWRPRNTDFAAIVSQQYRGNGTEDDPYIVIWLENDVENPKKYSGRYRWSVTMLAASMTLAVALASSAYSGAIEHVIIDFGCSEEVSVLGLSIMVLGYAMGPVLWAPLSELYGRRYVLILSFVVYTLWMCVTCASQNIATLIVFRFLAGIFGSSSLVIPGGEIADMFPPETRGLGIGIFCAAPFLGPSLGPLIGGFLGDAGGWRWVIGLLGIYAAVLTAIGAIWLPETYAPVLLRRRAALLTKVTGRKYLSIVDADNPVNVRELIETALIRPWALLFLEPIVLILTIYISCMYGTLYLCFGAFPIIFQQGRGWSAGIGGLGFIGICIGFLLGVLYVCWDNNRFVRLYRQANGHPPPECRLPPVIVGGVFTVVGLAWFAATDSPSIHWIVPILASAPFAFGMVAVFVGCGNYLVDAYVVYAASVFAGNGVIRSTFGAAFPLFTTQMFENIGIHWGAAVPGFIALACFPFPILFYYYGPKIRKSCKYAAEAARILEAMNNNQPRQEEAPSNEGSDEKLSNAEAV